MAWVIPARTAEIRICAVCTPSLPCIYSHHTFDTPRQYLTPNDSLLTVLKAPLSFLPSPLYPPSPLPSILSTFSPLSSLPPLSFLPSLFSHLFSLLSPLYPPSPLPSIHSPFFLPLYPLSLLPTILSPPCIEDVNE